MKIQQLLIPIIVGITSLTSQASPAQTLQTYEHTEIPIEIPRPSQPEKEDYCTDMKAILQKEDNTLEKNEIKYKRQKCLI